MGRDLSDRYFFCLVAKGSNCVYKWLVDKPFCLEADNVYFWVVCDVGEEVIGKYNGFSAWFYSFHLLYYVFLFVAFFFFHFPPFIVFLAP